MVAVGVPVEEEEEAVEEKHRGLIADFTCGRVVRVVRVVKGRDPFRLVLFASKRCHHQTRDTIDVRILMEEEKEQFPDNVRYFALLCT